MLENQPKPKAAPKDVFMHLFMIGTLYASAVSLITLLFQYINRLLPDIINPDYGTDTVMRGAIAVLIVVFPVFVWLTHYLNKEMLAVPEKQNLSIRKWLINLTLFVSAIAIVVDLVTLIKSFLDGELSWRFVLKIIVVLLVAAGIFAYYIWSLRNDQHPATRYQLMKKIIAWASIAVVGVSIVAGFFLAGSPFRARDEKFDLRRVDDLQSIQWQITNYWTNKTHLPNTLNELNDSISGFVVPLDPETNQSYEYTKTGELAFNLCATFIRETSKNTYPAIAEPMVIPAWSEKYNPVTYTWNHSTGYTCFTRAIDPDLYKQKSVMPAPLTR